ncbi:MAG: type IV pilus assembly protein [Planctomycetota bacterium]|nr:MAG: type IV pilus assembly protein [Planctomycetota bacterium]
MTFRLAARLAPALLALALASAGAEEPSSAGSGTILGAGPEELRPQDATVSIDIRDMPLPEVLRRLTATTGVNVVADPGIADRVTVTLIDVPWREALSELCRRTKTVARDVSERLVRVERPPRVTADFKNSPLLEVIDVLAGKAGANIVIAPEVDPKTRITMRFQDVPWNDALDALVKTAGYAAVTEASGIVRIVSPEKLETQLETRSFAFRYLRPQDLYRPKIKADTLVGEPKGVDDPVKQFTALDALRSALTRRGDRAVGSLQYVQDANTIIVTDTTPALDQIRRLVERLDVEPYQVHLECKVVTTTNADLAQVGILYTTGTQRGISIGSSVVFLPNNAGGSTFFGGGAPGSTPFTGPNSTIRRSRLPFGIGQDAVGSDAFWATDFGITATLRLFQQDTDSRIDQAPSLTALSDAEATLFVGQTVRWGVVEVASTQSGTTTSSLKEAANSPIQVGFQLLVVPHVVPGTNRIVLTLIPQTNQLVGTSEALPGFDEFELITDGAIAGTQRVFLPRVATTSVLTRMLVESGGTAVVGGLVEDRDTRVLDKIPFLGDVPIVGHLFRHTDTIKIKNHIIVFVTPRIVRTHGAAAAAATAKLDEARAREASENERLKQGLTPEEWEEKLKKAREDEAKEHERLKNGK